jgi:hypothetical protein
VTRGVLTLAAQRDLRNGRESRATEADVLHDVLEYGGRWPARRFRVEGSPLGASRLLRAADAERAAERYGGAVVEVAPSREAWEARERAREDARRADVARDAAVIAAAGAVAP